MYHDDLFSYILFFFSELWICIFHYINIANFILKCIPIAKFIQELLDSYNEK